MDALDRHSEVERRGAPHEQHHDGLRHDERDREGGKHATGDQLLARDRQVVDDAGDAPELCEQRAEGDHEADRVEPCLEVATEIECNESRALVLGRGSAPVVDRGRENGREAEQ
eukprot:7254537-Prymnesium_polylepis.1